MSNETGVVTRHDTRRYDWLHLRGALIAVKDQAGFFGRCETIRQFKELEWATNQVRELREEVALVLEVAIKVGKPIHEISFDELFEHTKDYPIDYPPL